MHVLLSVAALLAQEAPEEPGGIELLKPETSELIAGILAFAIIFFFIWKWAFPAIGKSLEARQQSITGRLQEAETAKQEAEGLLADYQQQLAGARSESDRIIDEARRTAEAMKADILAKAQTEASGITRKAQAEAAAERARLGDDLRSEVAALSLDVAEKVTAGGIDREAQSALVNRYIEELGGLRN